MKNDYGRSIRRCHRFTDNGKLNTIGSPTSWSAVEDLPNFTTELFRHAGMTVGKRGKRCQCLI